MVEESDIPKRPFKRFVTGSESLSVRVKPPNGMPRRMSFFGVQDLINGHRLQFTFDWHARPFVGDREPYYLMDIHLVNGPRVRKMRLEPGVFENITDMFPESTEAPDGQVIVLNLTENKQVITPKTLDDGDHVIVVVPGRLEVA